MQQTKGDTLLPNFYHWMERNSYICEAGAVFLSEPEAIQFNCAALCGEPMETFAACARKESNDEPFCEQGHFLLKF
uniref:Uncharacterized protein n=1 Tax=Ditylenchus dipsaci TaxID=166011 RepID=A0A915DV55_9BILA